MKPMKYIKDHMEAYMIRVLALVLCVIFLCAFRVQRQAIVACIGIFIAAALLIDLWDYMRKRAFYKRMETALRELDQKYLLPELLEEPKFYEGRIFVDCLRECDKSMAENVASYRLQSRQFREYIELWVHEAKIPVASLRLMCHNNPNQDHKMTGEIKRIDDYIENVLYYARSENAQKDYIIKEVSLKKVFKSVAVRNREALQIMGATIETNGLELSVMTDGKWLEYMIGQLLANSMKYSSPDRKLEIFAWAEENNDQIIFRFKDNGIGIPENDLPYVFEKTFTGSNGRGNGKSTGMGLYIVKNLCERLGHKVTISSKVGVYTESCIIFAKNDYYKMT
ncbi:MAG: HAMP domain-containing histidine kinase [Lachnospiraceae bacterium]|nr:HAMP domain-containing histidine kinase [Lachnospiraceae bacterium]